MSRAHRPSPCCNRRSRAIRADLDRDVIVAACAMCRKEFLSRLDPAAERRAPVKTIHDDLAKVINLEQRRAELASRGEP